MALLASFFLPSASLINMYKHRAPDVCLEQPKRGLGDEGEALDVVGAVSTREVLPHPLQQL